MNSNNALTILIEAAKNKRVDADIICAAEAEMSRIRITYYDNLAQATQLMAENIELKKQLESFTQSTQT